MGTIEDASHDIRELEAYLSATSLRIRRSVPLPESTDIIAWAPCGRRRWRLVLVTAADDIRPLLETGASVRLRALRALPALVRELGEAAGALEGLG